MSCVLRVTPCTRPTCSTAAPSPPSMRAWPTPRRWGSTPSSTGGSTKREALGTELVYAGFSMGVMPAQKLAQTRAGARGALLIDACLPVTEFGDRWPEGVPVQVHGMDADPNFVEGGDLDAAQALVDSTEHAELFLYPGDVHLFADSSLPSYDRKATELMTGRILDFLSARRGEARQPTLRSRPTYDSCGAQRLARVGWSRTGASRAR